MTAFRDRYGAGPLHLIAAIATAAIVAYAVFEIAALPAPLSFAIWFAGAIVAHDLVSFPLYTLLHHLAAGAAERVGDGAALRYVRVPAILSALLFVVWFPLILGLSSETYELKSGRSADPFLGRWLLITAVLFLGSGILYALRARSRGGEPAAESG